MNKKYFSLIEVMIAVGIVALAMMPLIFMNMRSNRVSLEARYRTIANKLINQKIEEFKFMDFVEFCDLLEIPLPEDPSCDGKDYEIEGDFVGKNALTSNEYPEEYARYRWKLVATPHMQYSKITCADLNMKVFWTIVINGKKREFSATRMSLKVNTGFVRLPDKNK